ncbi:MAG: hypothetical protein AMXMBFR84_34620 [Candidatus Hydrogenedentota bacterium]
MRIMHLLAFVLVPTVFANPPDLFEGAPPVPPGFTSYLEAQTAVYSGKIPAIKKPTTFPDEIEVSLDVVYATHGGEELKIDVFVPKSATKPVPGLLLIHGGGWRMGNRNDCHFYNVELAKLGYVTAAVQYRLSPKHHFPDAVHDVKHAIAWLRKNADTYHIDPKHLGVLGGSAGGHLTLMAGYAQEPLLECPDAPNGIDTRVQAIINLYGVVDCATSYAREAKEVTDFIGKDYEADPEAYNMASPLHHLSADDPPTLTFHGTIDELVPIEQADTLHRKLDELGVPNYYDRVEGWPHSMDIAKPVNDRCLFIMQRFLKKYLPLPE